MHMCKKQSLPSLDDLIKNADKKKSQSPKNSTGSSDDENILIKVRNSKPIQQEPER